MSSVDVLFIGDLHFDKLTKYFGTLDSLARQMSEIEKALTYAKKNGIQHIIFLGDICENVRLSTEAEFTLLNLLRRTTEYGLEVHIILGNHDFAENGIHSLVLFKDICRFYIKNVTIYDTLTDVEIENVPFRFCPYPYTEGKSNRLNVGHFEVSQSIRDNGHVIKVANNVRSKHHWVMGHLHTPHDVNNVHYVGTLYQTNFGEKNKKFFSHSTITLDDGVLYTKHRRVRNVANFEFINLAIEYPDDIDKIEEDANKLYKLFIQDGVDFDETAIANLYNVVDVKGYNTKKELKSLQEEDFIEINEQTLDLPSVVESVYDFFKATGSESLMDRANHYINLAKDKSVK